jgi:uncharacterized protein Yka (UPF0111/DUF47 family)
MKHVYRIFLVALVIGVFSCRDTKKEEEETKAVVEEIESVEAEVDKISEEADKDVKALEDALDDLDNNE